MRPFAHGQSSAWWRFLLPVALAATTAAQADTGGATVAESAPINDLLDRARDGARRGDWKFVVDSLQRVIDDPQGALTTVDGEIYESARMQAYRCPI